VRCREGRPISVVDKGVSLLQGPFCYKVAGKKGNRSKVENNWERKERKKTKTQIGVGGALSSLGTQVSHYIKRKGMEHSEKWGGNEKNLSLLTI